MEGMAVAILEAQRRSIPAQSLSLLGEEMDSNSGFAVERFESFLNKRESLNKSLDESRQRLDDWLSNQPLPPTFSALANLEVLLQERRNLHAELVAFDDEFVSFLAQLRPSAGLHDPAR